MKINIGVFEDHFPGTDRAHAPQALLDWYARAIEGFDPFSVLPAETELMARGSLDEVDVWLVSRETMVDVFGETFKGDPSVGLGAHLVHNPTCDPFGEESDFSRRYRVVIVSDEAECRARLAEEVEEDGREAYRHVVEYEEAELATLFHELAHVALFAANSNFNSPHDVDVSYHAGDLGNDMFDMQTGYGIRELPDELDMPMEAEDARDAAAISEEWCEMQGRRWARAVPFHPDGTMGFYTAMGVDVPSAPEDEPGV